jgi:hypothetical protein
MRDALAKAVFHPLNGVAAFFVFSLTSPQYEQIAGFLTFPLAVLTSSCAVLIAALSLVREEA